MAADDIDETIDISSVKLSFVISCLSMNMSTSVGGSSQPF